MACVAPWCFAVPRHETNWWRRVNCYNTIPRTENEAYFSHGSSAVKPNLKRSTNAHATHFTGWWNNLTRNLFCLNHALWPASQGRWHFSNLMRQTVLYPRVKKIKGTSSISSFHVLISTVSLVRMHLLSCNVSALGWWSLKKSFIKWTQCQKGTPYEHRAVRDDADAVAVEIIKQIKHDMSLGV